MSFLIHYGTPRHSGRYPWGSGDDPNQSGTTFRTNVLALKKQGISDVDIAKGFGLTTTQLRANLSLAKAEQRASDRDQALKLLDKGYSKVKIGEIMGYNESTIRSLLDPAIAERSSITKTTAEMLKRNVDEKGFIDIGVGIENHIGVTRTKLNTAVAELQAQGYKVHRVNIEQVGIPGQFTIVKVLGGPDSKWVDIRNDFSNIKSITSKSDDYGRSYTDLGLKPIESVSSKRLKVNFTEDGGSNKDGIIELRRGVKDLDLGNSKYAQVRIGIDGTHFLKGMAIYSDNMPDGIDIMFNTNKSKDVGKIGALKKMKDDKDNPFGATIKTQKKAINIVNEEGDWDNWSKTISSQVLSKQTVPLAKKQLGLALSQKKEEYDEILQLTNPVVKKQLLLAFGDDCDSSSVHLKAAALPRQSSKVILPLTNIKENHIYAPSFKDGEAVVLIRHPHGGTFEIPQLIVNNKNKEAQNIMKNAKDAVGIHPNVAKKLSGADFDGDTVIVIPNNSGVIKTSASLKGLENFDPVERYKIKEGSNISPIKPKTKQTKMGEVSNLITDMTIKGASTDELARAVRHSMVVIDSEKHNLDYRQSYIDHGIASLSAKYQNTARGGASTLVSRASSSIRVDERKARSVAEGGPIDPITGKKVYVNTSNSYEKNGKVIFKKTLSTKMAETEDANTLSSGRPIEQVYASYANSLKTLGNQARKEALLTPNMITNPSAKKVYNKEVDSLNRKLNIALMNKPYEREAQIFANVVIKAKMNANKDLDPDQIKKIKTQALLEARNRMGAKKTPIDITSNEWAAIQAGAVSSSKLSQILTNTDLDKIKQLATPRSTTEMTATKIAKANTMLSSGYTQSEVAQSLGISVTTLNNVL